MSQIDGSITIQFKGAPEALNELERFMGEHLASFRSFRDCAVSYDPAERALYLEPGIPCEDIVCFLGLVAARVPEAGFSGEADLDYVGSGGRYYALYQHEPGGAFQVGENSTDDFREDFLLDLGYAPEADGQVTEWLKTLPFSLKDGDYYENDSDDGYNKGDYWIYGKDGQEVRLCAFLPAAEELRALEESLKVLAAQVPSLEGKTYCDGWDSLVVDIQPGQKSHIFTISAESIPTGREDEFEDEFDG